MQTDKSSSSGSHDYIAPADNMREKKSNMFAIHYVSNGSYMRKGQMHTQEFLFEKKEPGGLI